MTSIRKELAHYLFRCNILQIMAQKIRQKIAENPYFQIETVFERFDNFKKGYLVPDDLSQFMLENKIYPSEIELYLIFRQLDKDRMGVITLNRLADQLLPKQNVKLSKKAAERKYYTCGFRLQIDLEYIIAKYFEHKIKEINQLATIRMQMNNKTVFIVQDGFKLLDLQRKGVISSINQIDSFMRSNGKVMQKDQLNRMFRYLGFDSENILYETFSQQIDPLGKDFYIGYSQKIAEKTAVQNQYLRRKLQMTSFLDVKQRQKSVLKATLEDVQISNSRLHRIMAQQAAEYQQHCEQLVNFRQRKYNI